MVGRADDGVSVKLVQNDSSQVRLSTSGKAPEYHHYFRTSYEILRLVILEELLGLKYT